ncbi:MULTISPECIES: S46 family peptidase [Weeksella]|uniref:S46 family peptidase n=1 Tax=Weeksella TaxID=1013 RepID=UPI0008A469F7|nr:MULTISPECIES: S46 family peptidase [Weeksella]MDK7375123.1 S46 family peptidase [Weeksella virosa]OFM85344.1 peptidase S46 [Weeksella sp. HMSC059D05]SUP55062.1 Peptidase S46 [Weeksella virosa]
MRKTLMKTSLLLSFLALGNTLFAQGGGMWIPTELNEKEMKEMGLKISATDIFSNGKKSINNAIAHFGGGCTSEVISPNGLLLTNHHCGYGQIQSHSSLENDYLKDGFWAKDMKAELPNKGLTATFIVDIIDVTDKILQGVTDNMPEEQRMELVKQNIQTLSAQTETKSYQENYVRPFYKGNKYYQFITETFRDVRLVGAPPSAIGKYGSDTDNWVWPRHTGDFALFRIYADKNNQPADYSPNNVPYKPKHFLPVNIGGIKEGDFTFVYGFPGTTDEYLPASSLLQIQDVINPARIGARTIALQHIDKKMREDDATRIKYASKQARISNAHKKWIGEKLGLERSKAVELRLAKENDFAKRIAKNKQQKKTYGNIIQQLNALNKENEKFAVATTLFGEIFSTNSETFRMTLALNNLANSYKKESYQNIKSRVINQLNGMYKDYDAALDQTISAELIEYYNTTMPKDLLPKKVASAEEIQTVLDNTLINGTATINGKTLLTSLEELSKNDDEFIKAIQQDPLVLLVKRYLDTYQEKVSTQYLANQNKMNQLMRTYMKAQLEVFSDQKLFPDANSTLRVTYGKVDGYQPRDAVYYEPVTYLDGVVEKHIPGDYEFDLPQPLIDLYNKKDFGKYADKNGKLPVNFIATNHTTGGNSGSPAIDGNGNLVGLNFDRVWEGTMSDLNYDPEICRNIMVDARYILWVIEKYGKADHLIKEMKIVTK